LLAQRGATKKKRETKKKSLNLQKLKSYQKKNMKYSGYPAAEYPEQCDVGFEGHSSCATYDHAHANHVDYDPSIVTYGGTPEKPRVSKCKAARKETFTGQSGTTDSVSGQIGCAKPEWWADKSCTMPPKHCGATKCGLSDEENPGCAKPVFWAEKSCHMPPSHCGARVCGGASPSADDEVAPAAPKGKVEGFSGDAVVADEYPGAMTATCGLAPVTLPTVLDCDAKLDLLHEPGCTAEVCANCMAPYSMPYGQGPDCGKEFCRCPPSCEGSAAKAVAPPLRMMQKVVGQPRRPTTSAGFSTIVSIVLALFVALLTYRMLNR
jgi:hypothetical protein